MLAPLVFSSYGWAQAHATYVGTGDDVIEISKPDGKLPALLLVSGNRLGRHFSIVAWDDSDRRARLLVNTTGSYVGIVPIDLPPLTNTTLLDISASGTWNIQVYSIGAAQRIKVPGTFEGEGDDVLWIDGDPSRATIQGNAASRHFAVTAYDGQGNRLGLQVNTTKPYKGTVIIPRGTLLLEMETVDGWSVELR